MPSSARSSSKRGPLPGAGSALCRTETARQFLGMIHHLKGVEMLPDFARDLKRASFAARYFVVFWAERSGNPGETHFTLGVENEERISALHSRISETLALLEDQEWDERQWWLMDLDAGRIVESSDRPRTQKLV